MSFFFGVEVSDSMDTINGGKVECGDHDGDEWWSVVERDWQEERRENVDEERERKIISCLAVYGNW